MSLEGWTEKDRQVLAGEGHKDVCELSAKIGRWLLHSPSPRDIASLGNKMKEHFLRDLVSAKQLYDLSFLGSIFFIVFCPHCF